MHSVGETGADGRDKNHDRETGAYKNKREFDIRAEIFSDKKADK